MREDVSKCTLDGFYISKVEEQTAELCTIACTQNGCALQWVEEEFITDELIKICMETDNKVILRLSYMGIDISEAIMFYACTRKGMDLQYFDNPSMDLCRVACESDGCALILVSRDFRNIEICTIACDQDPKAVRYVPLELVTENMVYMYIRGEVSELDLLPSEIQKKFYDIDADNWLVFLELSVYARGMNLKDIRSEWQTDSIIKSSIMDNGLALKFIDKDKVTNEYCILACMQNGGAIEFCPYQSKELCLIAIKTGWGCIEVIKEPTLEYVQLVYNQGGEESKDLLESLGFLVSEGNVHFI